MLKQSFSRNGLQYEHFKVQIQTISLQQTSEEFCDRKKAKQRNVNVKKHSSSYRLDPYLDVNGLLRVQWWSNLTRGPENSISHYCKPCKRINNNSLSVSCYFINSASRPWCHKSTMCSIQTQRACTRNIKASQYCDNIYGRLVRATD